VRRECRKNADATQCGQYDGFAAACRAVGRDIKDFDVCKMSYLGVAPDAAGARVMLDELATRYNTTPATLTEQMVVATPDEIAERLRTLTEIGINHHIFWLPKSQHWPTTWTHWSSWLGNSFHAYALDQKVATGGCYSAAPAPILLGLSLTVESSTTMGYQQDR